MFRAQKIFDFIVLAVLGVGFFAVMVMLFSAPVQASHESGLIFKRQVIEFCAPKGVTETDLKDDYGETPIRNTLQANGGLFTWWINVEKSTWTLTLTYATGVTCMIASGEGVWEPVVETAPYEDLPVW